MILQMKFKQILKRITAQFDEELAAMKIRTSKMWSYVPVLVRIRKSILCNLE